MMVFWWCLDLRSNVYDVISQHLTGSKKSRVWDEFGLLSHLVDWDFSKHVATKMLQCIRMFIEHLQSLLRSVVEQETGFHVRIGADRQAAQIIQTHGKGVVFKEIVLTSPAVQKKPTVLCVCQFEL